MKTPLLKNKKNFRNIALFFQNPLHFSMKTSSLTEEPPLQKKNLMSKNFTLIKETTTSKKKKTLFSKN